MNFQVTARAIAVSLAMLVVAGCAANPNHRDANRVSLDCPTGHTLTCEVDTVGRIHHGTFRKNLDKCACVSEDTRALESPAIPTIRQ